MFMSDNDVTQKDLLKLLMEQAQHNATRGELNRVEDKLTSRIDDMEVNLTKRIDSLESKVDAVDEKLTKRIDSLESKVDALETKMDSKFSSQNKAIIAGATAFLSVILASMFAMAQVIISAMQ